MEGQLTEAQKAVRSDRLIELEREMSRAYREVFAGKVQEVLFEETMEKEGTTYWIGHTPNYIKVAKKAEEQEILRNQIVPCRLGAFLEENIMLGVDTTP